jgi:NADPH-dependent 2,4-dienoyl-CoA reductase/sulfur reductase-like enzyme
MDAYKHVVVGGGMVAGYAAKELVELGLKPGELAILSADTSVPYERPPLSKSYLAGKECEDSILINPVTFYQEHGIELRLVTTVATLDVGRKRLTLSTGVEVTFENLLIATGARPRKLQVPGGDLGNVLYLRSLADSKTIRDSVRGAKRAVVVGGGFIAMEVASVLAQQQIDTTMVMPEDRIWKRFFTAEMSGTFEDYFAAHGVRFAKGASVREFTGQATVRTTELADGRSLPCDMVVAGVGVSPNIEFLSSSSIHVADGVMVDEHLETNVAGIYAAGDIANYPDLIFRKRRRVEHWDNAVTQAQHWAHTVMGERTPYHHVPYFFSDVFDLSYEFWGDPSDSDQVVNRGDLSAASFSTWWLRQGAVVAAFVMRRPEEERDAAQRWIASAQKVSPTALGNESVSIDSVSTTGAKA